MVIDLYILKHSWKPWDTVSSSRRDVKIMFANGGLKCSCEVCRSITSIPSKNDWNKSRRMHYMLAVSRMLEDLNKFVVDQRIELAIEKLSLSELSNFNVVTIHKLNIFKEMKSDPHHCHCFQVISLNSETISKMKQTGFKKQILEEPHGQIFSTTKRLDEYTQIHFKVLQDGTIESEMEYPPDYPIAHLNSIHSYSAHKETKMILNHFFISHKLKRTPPITCIQRKIVKAIKPSHWTTILGALVVVVNLCIVKVLDI